MQVSTPNCHVFRERINRRVVQHGTSPKGQICFAFPVSAPGGAHVQGREVDEQCMLFLQGGEEFMCHLPMNTDLFAITFDRDFFTGQLHQMTEPERVAALMKQPVMKVPSARLHACREQLLTLFAWAMQPLEEQRLPGEGHTDLREQALESALLRELLALLSAPDIDASRPMSTIRSYIVDKLHRQAITDVVNVPSIFEVCEQMQVSRRTIQNSFRTVAETTPRHYLRSVRLNGARRDIMATTMHESTIGDIASRWGFFHLSHFAEDYRALFGELPSQTARRPPRPLFQ